MTKISILSNLSSAVHQRRFVCYMFDAAFFPFRLSKLYGWLQVAMCAVNYLCDHVICSTRVEGFVSLNLYTCMCCCTSRMQGFNPDSGLWYDLVEFGFVISLNSVRTHNILTGYPIYLSVLWTIELRDVYFEGSYWSWSI